MASDSARCEAPDRLVEAEVADRVAAAVVVLAVLQEVDLFRVDRVDDDERRVEPADAGLDEPARVRMPSRLSAPVRSSVWRPDALRRPRRFGLDPLPLRSSSSSAMRIITRPWLSIRDRLVLVRQRLTGGAIQVAIHSASAVRRCQAMLD
jgi:hypothetical protein